MGDELPPWVTDISKLLLKRSSFSGNVLLSLRSDYDPTYVGGSLKAEEEWETQPIQHGPLGDSFSESARFLKCYGNICYTLGASEPWQF